MAKNENPEHCAVILAGGRGTRFWPRSRKRTPKQLLNIVSDKSMLRETVDRIGPLFSANRIWAVTNQDQVAAVRRELRRVPHAQILSEPIGRNTTAAIAVAAIHLAQKHPNAVMAVLPADHYIANTARYRRIVRAAMNLASVPGNLVVLGIPPTRPETGFGYIERNAAAAPQNGIAVYRVKKFTEKPDQARARQYVASGRYFWNAGMFFWHVSTFLDCLRKFLPKTWDAMQKLRQSIGTPAYSRALRRIYPRLENVSVDYAIMEPSTQDGARERVFVLPAAIGWSDIGSWSAVYELLARSKNQNVTNVLSFALNAAGNFIWTPGKFTAIVGLNGLVVVDTADALLICPRDRTQDVSKVVKWLEENRREDLL